jgi:alpha-D-xyloside xylohydrolase
VAATDEAFHGFGGRHSGVDLRGRSPVNWIQEENFGAGPLEPGREQLPGTDEHYLFPNGPTAAYYVQNSFVSSQGYGFLLDRPELSRYRLAYGREDAWQVDVAGGELDYVVAPGDGRTAVQTLTAVNGRHRVPPQWSQGLTLYRGVRVLSAEGDTAQSYEAKVRDDLRMIDETGLPVTSYAIEGWDLISRDVLQELIAELKARDIHVMAYFRAYVSADVANTEDPAQFTEAVEGGYLARTATGAPYFYGSSFVVGIAGLVDFTNPDAVQWWEGRVREALDLGIDGFMQDFGEQVQQDMHFANGETGLTMHNTYPNVFHRVTRDVFDRYQAENPGRELFFFTRAGFSGRPGSAAYENANFPGDETSDWNLGSGLPSIIPDMLNRGVGGSYGFTTDIGGYADYLSGSPTAELFTRWAQASSLTTFMRVHNSSSTGVRMPWSYDEDTLRRFADSAVLHARASR